MENKTSKKFKPAVTWYEYYTALQTGDICTVETALLVYDKQAITAPLDECDTAVKIAVKSGQVHVVRLLISDPVFTKLSTEERAEILKCAFIAASSNSQTVTADLLMENEYFEFTLTENQLIWLMNNTNLHIIQRYLNKKYEVQNIIPSEVKSLLVAHAIINGYFNISALDVIGDINEYVIEMDPLFKAMFLQDEETVRVLADSHPRWYQRIFNMSTLNATSSDLNLLSFIFAETYNVSSLHPFQYAGRLGNAVLLKTMREYLKDRNQLAAFMEDACDEACREGHTHLVQTILRERWVNTEYGKRWKHRMELSVEGCRTETSCLIIDTFLRDKPVSIQRKTPWCICERDTSFYDNIFTKSLRNNDFVVVEKLMEYQPANRKWAADCFEAAVARGKVDIIEKFAPKGASFGVKISQCWCRHWTLEVRSVVLLEILGTTCLCGTDILLKEIQYCFQPSFIELAYDLLLRDQMETDWEDSGNVEWMAVVAKWKKVAAFTTFLDHYDVSLLGKALSHSRSGSVTVSDDFIYNWKEICAIFTAISGTRLETVEWCGLLDGIKKLDDAHQRAFRQLIYECGVTVTDGSTEDLPSSTDQHRVVSDLPLPVVMSLKSSCRLGIRRSIRLAHPIGSMRDMVLTLYTHGYLPRTLVPYMLFRDWNIEVSDKKIKIRESEQYIRNRLSSNRSLKILNSA